MKKRDWSMVDTLCLMGGGLIAVGVGLWSLPAGLIAAGVACVAGAVLIDLSHRGGKDGDGA